MIRVMRTFVFVCHLVLPNEGFHEIPLFFTMPTRYLCTEIIGCWFESFDNYEWEVNKNFLISEEQLYTQEWHWPHMIALEFSEKHTRGSRIWS